MATEFANRKYQLWAEAVGVDDQPSNDVYMQIQMRMMSTAPNGNGCVVERDFMDAVIENQDFYSGTPVKVDINALVSGDQLGHKFDSDRKEWLADQIGAITSFSLKDEVDEETGETVTVMLGNARIEKGRADVCEAIIDLYEAGKLFFSFEIIASEVREDEETGLVYIGAGEHNHLTAMCVVSIPAYDGATATTFVAEMENENMNDNQFENLTKWASELEIDAVRRRCCEALFAENNLYGLDWGYEIRELGANYMLLKHWDSGEYRKVEYHVAEDEVVIDDVYPVVLTRKTTDVAAEQEQPPVEETTEEQAEEQVEQHEAEEQTAEETESEAEAEQAETETVEAEQHEAEAEHAEETTEEQTEEAATEEVDALQAELEELRAFKQSVEAERLAAEKQKKVAKLRAAAELLGIDTDAMSAEIDSLDYEKIMASVSAEADTETEKNDAPINPNVTDDDMALKPSRWADYVTDPTGLGE